MSLSVLQSVYFKDNPNFLSTSLESLKKQTLPADKIILIKDGTLTPELEAIISYWEDKLPIKVVGYEQNRGLAHALNYGLQFVDTDLVARMDSDDIANPERFEKQIEYFNTHNDCEILGSGIIEFYNSNAKLFSKKRVYPVISSKDSKTLFKGTPLAHPTLMIKTPLLKQYKYSEETSMNEDIELWFRVITSGHIIHNLSEPLLNFRITDGTFKRRSIKKAINEFKIYWTNLTNLFGVNYLLIYPVLRLFSRFLPFSINKKLYFSKFRTNLFTTPNGRGGVLTYSILNKIYNSSVKETAINTFVFYA